MSGCGLLRMPEGVYDDDLLALYGLEDAQAMLPPTARPDRDRRARHRARRPPQTGLAEGTPVVAGYFDVVASALGSGVVAPGEASIIAGTWSHQPGVLQRAGGRPERLHGRALRPRPLRQHRISATSAANLEWYVREFVERGGHHDDPFGFCNAASSAR